MTEQTLVRARPAPAASRVGWVDLVKGLAILGVVAHHAIGFAGRLGELPAVLTTLDHHLALLRMPVFFLAAGLFAVSTLRRPWRDVLHRRVALYAWAFVLWSAIGYLVTFVLLPTQRWDGSLTDYLHLYLVPDTVLWFVYALALYHVVLRALRRVPAWLQLLVTAVASVLAGSGLLGLEWRWRMIVAYLFFFALGVHGSTWVRVRAERLTGWGILAAVAAFPLGSLALGLVSDGPVVGSRFVLSLLACGSGVALAVAAARVPALARLAGLGRRTLPIYVAHLAIIQVLVALATGLADVPPWATAGLALVLVAAAVAGSLAIERLARRAGAGWLYALPRRWAWRSDGQASDVGGRSARSDSRAASSSAAGRAASSLAFLTASSTSARFTRTERGASMPIRTPSLRTSITVMTMSSPMIRRSPTRRDKTSMHARLAAPPLVDAAGPRSVPARVVREPLGQDGGPDHR